MSTLVLKIGAVRYLLFYGQYQSEWRIYITAAEM